MKKLSILLALVLLLSMLTACNPEETIPDQKIPGYNIGLSAGTGWTIVDNLNVEEEVSMSKYDLEMTKDGMSIYAIGFSPADFIDLPLAEDLYIDCTDSLLESLTDVSTLEAQSGYTSGDKNILESLYAGKEDGVDKQFYCFMVDFGEETGNMVWVCFAAKESAMKKNKSTFKSIVEGMVCTAEPYDYESSLADELYFDEEGNLIVDETEPETPPAETEPEVTAESNPPEPTAEDPSVPTIETTAPAESTSAAAAQ